MKSKNTIGLTLIITAALGMTSCVTNKPLYTWGNYDVTTYNYIKNETEKSLDDLLETYAKLMENQKGERKTVPPGLCADYGFLLYKKGEKNKAIEMLKMEIALYPESATFITRIIKKLEE